LRKIENGVVCIQIVFKPAKKPLFFLSSTSIDIIEIKRRKNRGI
jgi:hypothetical protein